MTIAMPDSVRPLDLPPGYPAYLAYADGRWVTVTEVRKMFPAAHILSLTVLGGTMAADGCDIENGDLSPASGAAWLHWRVSTGAARPVAYASVLTTSAVLAELAALGVQRQQVRLLTAHYGAGEHICGPRTCGELAVDADGTQWTDAYPGVNGASIDMSALADDFFGAPSPVTVEVDVKLQELRQGSSGQQVRNAQALIVSHGLGYMIATGAGNVEESAGIDGAFGPKTEAATRALQAEVRVPVTGVWDAATWTAALG